MNYHEAFLADIIDHPDNDSPRLIYADWLEEQGGAISVARAEFIRVQITLARLAEEDDRRTELEARARELYDIWETTPGEKILRGTDYGDYRRGFVERIELSAAQMLKRAPILFQRAPIREVSLENVGERIRNILALPYLNRLRRLEMVSGDLTAFRVSLLADCPSLTGLEGLSLRSNPVRDEGMTALASSPHLARLSHLDLGHTHITPNGARALSTSPYLTRLRSLNFHFNGLGAVGTSYLTNSHLLDHVTELDLGFNEIGDEGATALAGSRLHNLTTLDLSHAELSDTGLLTLVGKRDLWERLTALQLQYNFISDRGAQALAEAPLDHLRTLNLCKNSIGGAGIAALAHSPQLAGLQELDIETNPIGDEGARALASSPVLSKLILLTVGPQNVGHEGQRILNERFAERLRWYP